MAISLLSLQPSLLDLQTIFDPFPINLRSAKTDLIVCSDLNQMDANGQINYVHQLNNNADSNNGSLNSSNNVIDNSNTNTNTNTNTGNTNNSSQQHMQNSNNTTRSYLTNYHHQNIVANYEQVINFVDSPPNSEGSWTDEHSKESPGPQIIDVQTIFSNSHSRKRRMDWDSLDIVHSENSTATTQASELSLKAQQERDKYKKEKLTGRSSWTDDIGFDLNSEFNNNSYLSNEPFLSFSPALSILKQEPQNEQLKDNKRPLKITSYSTEGALKIEKSVTPTESRENSQGKPKNELNNNSCGCDSPQKVQQSFQQNATTDKTINSNASDHSNAFSANKYGSRNGIVIQQLSTIDDSKTESDTNNFSSNVDDHKFQYILAAATSIATKNNEETLTYLNQGQSYEIKLKKIGDLSFYRDKILKSVIKICFHERRLQFMEREQMQQWQNSRPGERIVEVDVPLSYGLCHVAQPLNPNYLNIVEVFWDPLKEVGVYIKVNCISTEFTPKKHGGEKGVPFRLQIETYIDNINSSTTSPSGSLQTSVTAAPSPNSQANLGQANNMTTLNIPQIGNKQPVHAAACQIKVFKLKGADRKHKQDREKIQKRPQSEQDKFQPSYECTIMNDIPLDVIAATGGGCLSPDMKMWPNSPIHIPKYDGILPYANVSPTSNSSPIAINSVTSTNSPTLKVMEANIVSPVQPPTDMEDYGMNLMPESTPAQVTQWLTTHRLTPYLSTFAHFSGSDIMRMSKEDLIQICGVADGIRMYNILRAKAITPRLTIYISLDGSSYNALYLISNTSKELIQKLVKLPGFYETIASGGNSAPLENGTLFNNWNMHSKYSGSGSNIFNEINKSFIYLYGPSGVLVTITDDVLNNEITDGSLYILEVQNGKVLIKLVNKNDN